MKRRLFLVIHLFSVAFPKLTAGLAAVGGPSLDVFLRFSPLIGGPKFAPLHVEVMIKKRESDSDAFNRSTPNEENVLHRFDFVPSSPTDPRTLGQLLTFRSVPGLVRYRTLEIRGGEGNRGGGSVRDDESFGRSQEFKEIVSLPSLSDDTGPKRRVVVGRNGLSFLLRSIDMADSDCASEVISGAEQFVRSYQQERGKLSVLGNSCYVFAFDLMRFIDGHDGSR